MIDLTNSTIIESESMFIMTYPISIIGTNGDEIVKDVFVYSSAGQGVNIETINRNESTRIPLTVFV